MELTDEALRTTTLKIMTAYQTLMTEKRWEEWIELWADEGVLDFPFAPAGRKRAYVGKKDILDYMTAASGKIAIDGADAMRIFPMQDPNIAVVEVTIRGHVPMNGAPYNQSYVLFFEVLNGRLQHYREYWNPMVSIDAVGDRKLWTDNFGSPEDQAFR